MTSKEIAEMIQRAKEAEALFDGLRDDERPVYSTLQKVGSALDELIQFAERPVYEPVKTEDLIPGYYWLVTPDGEKTIEQIWDGYGHGALGMESPEGWVAVSEIYELGGVLYSIPPLEVSK